MLVVASSKLCDPRSLLITPQINRVLIALLRRQTLVILCVAALVLLSGCSGTTDIDGDGLNKNVETKHGLDDTAVDSDGDGLNDSRELNDSTLDPSTNDTDNDGLSDGEELERGTKPDEADTDNDGVDDRTEVDIGSDPTAKDSDGDGVDDGTELNDRTSPTVTDTDGDGLTDNIETNDRRLDATRADTDGDGLTDEEEQEYNTDPSQEDTDQDGLDDAGEMQSETSPTNPDTDGDGLPDGVEAPPYKKTPFDSTKADTDDDGLEDDVEKQIGTNPANGDTDGDGQSDREEYRMEGVSPTKNEVKAVTKIEGSPDAGLTNDTLKEETLRSVEFLSKLPKDRTKRDEVVTETATRICDTHDSVVSNTTANTSDIGADTYRNTYRVAHAAEAMQELGADINPSIIQQRMRTARKVSGVASTYAPIFGSYQRLHSTSCAVKHGEPGAKRDFYIAAAEFTMDLALAKENVMYKASFKTTGYVAQKTGMMRLARVCGYKCVGMVESELHWAVRGTYSGTLDTISKKAIDGNFTADGWNQSTQKDVGEYLENTTNTVFQKIASAGHHQTAETPKIRRITFWPKPSSGQRFWMDVNGQSKEIQSTRYP